MSRQNFEAVLDDVLGQVAADWMGYTRAKEIILGALDDLLSEESQATYDYCARHPDRI